jgi:hypothetical protein
LSYVRAFDAEATVVVFPSDHFIYPERRRGNQCPKSSFLPEGMAGPVRCAS